MKLHLNLTLRRAVLAAMAMLAVGTAQAVTTTYNGKGDAYITGKGTIDSNEWNDIWNKHKSGTLTIGTSEGDAEVFLEKTTYNKGQIIFIGGRGNGSDATTGNNGTLNVGNGTLNVSDAIHVGNSQSQVTGMLTVDGGSVVAGSELTVGAYKGTGVVGVKNGSLTVKTDADGGVLRVGYHNGGGHNTELPDEVLLINSTITVGEAGGAVDKTSIGQENGIAKLTLNIDSTAILHDQTIVGENSGSGLIEVKESSSLIMTGTTTLGWKGEATGKIVVESGSDATSGMLVAGDSGTGILDVAGTLNAGSITLANKAGSKGALTSTGNITTGVLSIGQAGSGSAEIKGGALTASDIILGNEATGNGKLTIAGGITQKIKTNSLTIGDKGKGELVTESNIEATSTAIGTAASSATVAGGAELTTGYLGINGTLNLGDEEDEATGKVIVNGDLQLGSTGTINIAKNTPKEEYSILTTNGNALIYGSVNNTGVWEANGSTLNYGTITNDGSLGVTDSMTSWGTIKGSGSLAVAQKGDTLTLLGSTNQGSVSNNGDIIIKGAGSLTADEIISKEGTTTIVVDGSFVNRTENDTENGTVITLAESTSHNIDVDIDMADASALVGKDVKFIEVAGELTGLDKDNDFELLNNSTAAFEWEKSYIGYTAKEQKNRLHFTAYDSTNAGIGGMKFTGIDANVVDVEINKDDVVFNDGYQSENFDNSGVTTEIYDRDVEGTATAGTEINKDKVEGTITESKTAATAELTDTVDQSAAHYIVIGADVDIVNPAGMTVKSTATVQNTTIQESGSSTAKKETGVIGTGGLALSFTGESKIVGDPDAKGILGFEEGAEGSLTIDENGVEETTYEVKLVDVISIEAGADVTLQATDMHSSHALTINGGETEDTRAKLKLDGGSVFIGGSNDVNLTYTVEVDVYDNKGNKVGKKKEQRESGDHITTDSVIKNADIELDGDAHLAFKTINDADHGHHGHTYLTNSTLTLKGGDATLGVETGVEDKDHPMQTVVFQQNSALKGTGHVSKIRMEKGTTLTVGNSPGVLKVSDAEFNETRVQFHFITSSDAWSTSGNTSSTDKATGAISQLLVDKAVTLNNASIEIVYEKADSTANSGYSASSKDEMKVAFEDGATITLVTGNLAALSGSTYTFDAETWLPKLEDGLYWDTTQLFTTGMISVFAEILEEPVRVANSMVSAGDTVLDFGRVAEAQAKLRKAGTTRVWGSALGSFDSVDSDGARTGYDYNSWGGAVGVDHAFTSRSVLGVAFGCSWGENEAEKDNGYYSAGSIDQDATMIGLYGTHKFRTKGLMNDMKLSAFAAYGQFENSSSRTGLKSGHNATAEWDSDAWVLSASLSRDITTDSGLVVTPYVGVEYTKAGMEDFTEKGKGYNATYTADEDYSNLAVKVGVSVSKTIGSFTPYAGIAYINDVARDTPKVTASGKRTITGEASMPGRSAVQLNLGTGVKLSDSWDAYAGYTAELRSKATEHNVNVGVGYTF